MLHADHTFPFGDLELAELRPGKGGAHTSSLGMLAAGGQNAPCYVQLPACTLKQGIVKTKRGTYADLMYDRTAVKDLVDWSLKLEAKCCSAIHSKRADWFQDDIAKEEIESMLSPITRLYRSGENVLIRVGIDQSRKTGEARCLVYDQKEEALSLHDVKPGQNIVPLIHIKGVKFTSRSFEIDFNLIQLMVLDPPPEPLTKCLIQLNEPQAVRKVSTNSENEPPDTSVPNDSGPSVESSSGPEAGEIDVPDATEASLSQHTSEAEGLTQALIEGESGEEAKNDNAGADDATDALEGATPDESKVNADDSLTAVEETQLSTDCTNSESLGTCEADLNRGIQEVGDIELSCTDAAGEPTLRLRPASEVYHEIYRAARLKAKQMRKAAVDAILEARQIRTKYDLSVLDDSDDEEELSFGS